MSSLLQSRRFWTMLAGIVISLVLFFASKYLPAALADVTFVIDIIMPLVIALIAAFTVSEAVETITQAQVEIHAANLNAQMAMHAATLSAQGMSMKER